MTSSDVSPGMRYMCCVDICTEGIQFCDKINTRCRYCSDFAKNCLTNLQERNCTRYCMEEWTKTQQKCFNQENNEFPLAAIIVIIMLGLALLVCLIFIMDEMCLGSKMRHYIERFIPCCKSDKQQQNNDHTPEARYDPVSPFEPQNAQNRPRSPIEDDREEGEGREAGGDVQSYCRTAHVPRGFTDSGRNRGDLGDSGSSNNHNPSTEMLSFHASVYRNNDLDNNVSSISNGATYTAQENRDRNESERVCHTSGVEHLDNSQSNGDVTGELTFDSSRHGPQAISYQSDNINPRQDTGYETGTTNHSQTLPKTYHQRGHYQGRTQRISQISQINNGQTSKTKIRKDGHNNQNGTPALSEQDWQPLSNLTESELSV